MTDERGNHFTCYMAAIEIPKEIKFSKIFLLCPHFVFWLHLTYVKTYSPRLQNIVVMEVHFQHKKNR